MKKQIFILIMALIAISFSTAYGQTAFDPPTCTATALTPAAGEKYNYAATITGAGYDGTGNFTWYVTQDVNLLTGAVIPNNAAIIATGAGSYNTAIASADNIDIIWTSAALADGNPYYLAVKYEQANSTGSCSAMNMKVYRVVPINTFWLRIESVADASGTAGGVEQCAAAVTGATMTEPAGTVEYTYGENVLYVKISATGYVGNWTPTLRITGAVDDQAIGASGITWTSGGANGIFTGGGAFGNGDYTSNNPMPSTMAVAPAITGTEIIVTIPLANNHHEALADQTISVAIDGFYANGATVFNDKSDVNSACSDALAFEDTVNKIIKARPGITATDPTVPFATEPLTKP